MEDERPKRPRNNNPAQKGGSAALSSSGGQDSPAAETQLYWESATSFDTNSQAVSSGTAETQLPDSTTRPGPGLNRPPRPGGIAPRPTPTPRPNQETSLTRSPAGPPDDSLLEPGTVLANRYEIIDVLGQGGMGAVYKAADQELDRLVALKVIRPALARIPEIVERFKQELRLSHHVTHINVVRMYDLGEDAGLRFITMEFIEGRDLRSLILEKSNNEKGKFTPEEAVDILSQVCLALDAAHSVGVIHRDLKPQNIMIDTTGRVVVMDFGLARTLAGDGMTQSGALLGTFEYMSPEQALGKELDQRSDIFALGLIAYEMLTGKTPFVADTALASLIKRTQEAAEPLNRVDQAIPAALSGIVGKCLERDASLRYNSTTEILADLDTWRGKRAAASLGFNAHVESSGPSARWPLIAGGIAAALLLSVGGVVLARHYTHPATTPGAESAPSISLAVMPFYNASSDPTLNWLGSSLSDVLSSSIGDSQSVRMVSPDRLHQVLHDLHISEQSQVDVATLRRMAEFTSADRVIYGQYVRAGEGLRIETTVLDLENDSKFTLTTNVPQEKAVLSALDALSAQIREKLATNRATLHELAAHAERPSTNSVEALHAYDTGLQLVRQGDNLGAATSLEQATTTDPNFALAFSELGTIYSNLGHDDLAEKASRRAVELSDSLPRQERELIEANNARITHDNAKAIQAYEQLAKQNPGDTDVQFALAGLYEQAGNFAAAKQQLIGALNRDPKNVDLLLASGRVEIKAGNAQPGLDFLTRALNLAIQLDNQEEKAAILQASGIAYNMLDRPEDALRNYQESLTIKTQIGDKRGQAASLEEIANIQDATGHPDDALANYKRSLAVRRDIGDKVGIGNTLIDTGSFYHDHGKLDDALKFYEDALQIERELGDEANQALCLNNIGGIRLDKGDYQDALTFLQQAYELRQKGNVPGDIAESLHNLAEANLKLGQYDTALGLYLKAIQIRRTSNDQEGVAMESDSMATIFAAQGRYGAALSSMQDAVKIAQQSKDVNAFTVEIDGGWGDLLAQVGRADEGHSSIEEALATAHKINNDASVAMATNWLGDEAFYKGDYNAARDQYDRALQIATKASSRERILLAKIGKAKVDVNQGHGQSAMASLKKLGEDADSLGLQSASVECSIYLATAMLASGNTKAAREQLDLSLARAEKLELRVPQAKAHYELATLLAHGAKNGEDSKEATPHYREVVRILQSVSQEQGATRILERADLQPLYRDSLKSFQGPN